MNQLLIFQNEKTIQNQEQNTFNNLKNYIQSKENKQQFKQKYKKQKISQNKYYTLPIQNDVTIDSLNNLQEGLQKSFLMVLRRKNLIKLLSSKQCQQRSDKQNKLIMQIIKNQPFFSSIANNYKNLIEIASKIQYKYFEVNKNVYSINQLAEGCFILIQGQVQLSIPQRVILKVKVQTEDQKLLKLVESRNAQKNLNVKLNKKAVTKSKIRTQRKSSIQNKQQHSDFLITSPMKTSKEFNVSRSQSFIQANLFSDQKLRQKNISIIQQQQIVEQIKQDKIVRIIKQGQCFGQVSVGQINRRATNARTKANSHLIFIRKQYYDLISRASLNTQMRSRHSFLNQLQLFKKVYKYSVEAFLYYMTQVSFKYKENIFKQGQEIKYVYIIKHGQFSLSKIIQQNARKLYSAKKRKSINIVQNQNIKQLRRVQNKWRQGMFKVVYPGEILGDSQVFMKQQTYKVSCKCLSQTGRIYKIDKNIFLDKLLSSENKVDLIKTYLTTRNKNKKKQMQSFLKINLQNQLIQRILPASNSCDIQLKRKLKSQNMSGFKEKTKINLDNNFFDNFNKTCLKTPNKKKINRFKIISSNCIDSQLNEKDCFMKKRSNSVFIQSSSSFKQRPMTSQPLRSNTCSLQIKKNRKLSIQIPAGIKDIVSIVNNKQKYSQTRLRNSECLDFSFQKPKIPRFIQQKYKHLLKTILGK